MASGKIFASIAFAFSMFRFPSVIPIGTKYMHFELGLTFSWSNFLVSSDKIKLDNILSISFKYFSFSCLVQLEFSTLILSSSK